MAFPAGEDTVTHIGNSGLLLAAQLLGTSIDRSTNSV